MRTKLLYAPLALAMALAVPSPANAGPCELVYLYTGDQVLVCLNSGGCTVDVSASFNPPGPKSYTCLPYPAGPPPYCNGVTGTATVDTCVLDPGCTNGIYVFIDPPGDTVCI